MIWIGFLFSLRILSKITNHDQGVQEMDIEYGSEVTDRSGTVLGTVDYVIRNSWTGEIGKFVIFRQAPEGDLAFSPEDVLETTGSRIRLDVASDELNENK
jgi:hypothetical protein